MQHFIIKISGNNQTVLKKKTLISGSFFIHELQIMEYQNEVPSCKLIQD